MGNYFWDELVLEANSIEPSFIRKLIEDFWPKVVHFFSRIKDIEIAHPTDEAWFHIRRAYYTNRNKIDVLRLKRGFLSPEDMERIRLLAESYSGIAHANWHRWSPEERHDNAFLSFLQKLSVLRARDGICYNRFLGQTPQDDYDKDPRCKEAYKVMTTADGKWYRPLIPWFDHMSATHMDSYRTHEYAHWFGHIISGWPDIT